MLLVKCQHLLWKENNFKIWNPWTPLNPHTDLADQCGNMHHDAHSETMMIMTYWKFLASRQLRVFQLNKISKDVRNVTEMLLHSLCLMRIENDWEDNIRRKGMLFLKHCSDSIQFLLLQKLDIRLGCSKSVLEEDRRSESPLTSRVIYCRTGSRKSKTESVGITYDQSCQVSLPSLEDSKNKTNNNNKKMASLHG